MMTEVDDDNDVNDDDSYSNHDVLQKEINVKIYEPNFYLMIFRNRNNSQTSTHSFRSCYTHFPSSYTNSSTPAIIVIIM